MILDKNGNPILSTLPGASEIATRQLVEGLMNATAQLTNPSKTLTTISKAITAFDQVRRQPDVAAASLNYKSGIAALIPDLSQSTTQGARAEFLQGVLNTLDLPRIIGGIVSAREYGYAVLEVVWGKVDKWILPIRIEEKPREWFFFDQGNRLRLRKQGVADGVLCGGDDPESEYPRSFLLIQHEASYLNPYGVGLLDTLYWYVMGLYSNFEWLLRFIERFGHDFIIGKVPSSADQKFQDATLSALMVLRNRAAAVFKEGTQIEFVENKGRSSSSDTYIAFEKLVVGKINKLYLGTELLDKNDASGARASSQTGADIRDDALAVGKSLVEHGFNTILRWISEVNTLPGSDAEVIRFVLTKPAETTKEQAEIDQIYATAGDFTISEQLLLRRGYEKDDFIPKQPVTNATGTGFAATSSGYGEGLDGLLNAVEAAKKKP
jgi:hypothetical protein